MNMLAIENNKNTFIKKKEKRGLVDEEEEIEEEGSFEQRIFNDTASDSYLFLQKIHINKEENNFETDYKSVCSLEDDLITLDLQQYGKKK